MLALTRGDYEETTEGQLVIMRVNGEGVEKRSRRLIFGCGRGKVKIEQNLDSRLAHTHNLKMPQTWPPVIFATKSCRRDREWKTGRRFHLSLRMRGRTSRSQTAPPSLHVRVRLSGKTNPTWKSLFFSIEMTPIVGAKKCCRSFSSEDSKHQHRPISSFDLEQGH